MSYSSNPVQDALDYGDRLEEIARDLQSQRECLEDQINGAIGTGDANHLCSFSTTTDWDAVKRQPVDQRTATALPRRAQTLAEVLMESINGYPEVESQLVQLMLNACKSSDATTAQQAQALRDQIAAKWVEVQL